MKLKNNINKVILNSIKLKNFMTFEEYEIDNLADDNIIVITGKNANGKSTLTSETINYGLFGKSLRFNKIEDMISWNSEGESFVDLGLKIFTDVDETKLNIKRTITAGNKSEVESDNDNSEIYNILKKDIKKNDFNSHIRDMLDIDEKKFNMIYLKSPFSEVLFESNSELLSSITKSQYINELRKDFNRIVKDISSERGVIDESIEKQKNLIESINKEIKDSSTDVDVESHKERLQEILNKIDESQNNLKIIGEEISSKRSKTRKINETLIKIQDYISGKNSEIKSLSNNKIEIENLVRDKICPKCKQKIDVINCKKEIEDLDKNISDLEKDVEDALRYRKKVSDDYSSNENDLNDNISKQNSINRQIIQLNNLKSDIKAAIESSKKEKKNNDTIIKKIKDTIVELNDELKVLSRDYTVLNSICKIMLNKNSEYINKFYNSKIYDFTIIFKSILSKLTNGKFVDITIKLNNKPTINGEIEYNALSSSERKFVDISFVISYIVYLSTQMKFKTFILDEFFDTFDQYNIVNMYEIIDEISKKYDLQIIITSNMSEFVMSYLSDTSNMRIIDITRN